MHTVQFAESPYYEQSRDSEDLPILSYKDIMDARQKKLDEKSKSAVSLHHYKNLELSPPKTKLPPVRTKQQQPSLLRKLNYDFGSLNEFLSYDLKLKKPEELFKLSGREKKLDLKSKEEDLKKGLMQHMKQEIDNRDVKTILVEERDPEKVLKAAKKFIGDMVNEIFKDEINIMEKKLSQKGMNKLYEAIMDLDEDNPVRKIAEKYGYKTLVEKFAILDAEIEKKRNPDNLTLNNTKKSKALMSKGFLQSLGSFSQADSNLVSPLELGRGKGSNPIASRQQQPSISINKVPTKRTHLHQLDSNKKPSYVNIYEEARGYNRFKNSGSPNRDLEENGRLAFVMKVISGSATLMPLYTEYEKEEKEKENYNNEIKKYEANTRSSFVDLYSLGDHEKVGSISETHVVITHHPHRHQMWLHILLQYQSFSSLSILNLRGCGIHETFIWFYLSIIDKYSPEIKLIDISGNQISPRVCEVAKDILTKVQLKSLKMANVDLRSKGLATICLGLAQNTSLVELDLNYNNFDEHGFKALALILRHTRTLQSVKILRKKKIEKNNYGEEIEVEEELGYSSMAALTKAFKHNKFLDPKNILIFEPK